MTTSDHMQRLEAVLAAYGADASRWPSADRARLDGFVAVSAQAQARIAEERSFDTLLSTAPAAAPAAAMSAATERLFARLETEPQVATVVAFKPRAHKAAAPLSARPFWRELSVMAAALLIGFFTVSQGVLDGTGLDLSPLTTVAASDADDVSAIALGTATDETSEEDLL